SDQMCAGSAARCGEADLLPVDAKPSGLADGVGDLLAGHGAVELSVLARAMLDGEHGLGEERRGLLAPLAGLLGGTIGCLLAAARLLERRVGGRLGELAGLKVVAQVA